VKIAVLREMAAVEARKELQVKEAELGTGLNR
jgi:hypothetical protein